jgi:HEAT repeat protein
MTDWKRPRSGGPAPRPVPNIWLLQSRADIESLIAALTHHDPGTRRGAAAALRALGAWHAVPALQAALAMETDWQAHAAISAAIQYLDRDIHVEGLIRSKDVRGLCKMLNSNRHEEIFIAAEALGTIGDRSAVEPLIMVFRNPLLPGKTRLAAAEALLKLESAPAVVTLLRALRSEDWKVRLNAAMILGQVNATWATVPLGKALEDPQPEVIRAAAESLRRFNTAEAVEVVNNFVARLRKVTTKEIPKPAVSAPSMTLDAKPVTKLSATAADEQDKWLR